MPFSKTNRQNKLDTCFELYRKYRNRGHVLIETEMRRCGWERFSRRNLYSRVTKQGIVAPGWIERYGWDKLCDEHDGGRACQNRLRKRAASSSAAKISRPAHRTRLHPRSAPQKTGLTNRKRKKRRGAGFACRREQRTSASPDQPQNNTVANTKKDAAANKRPAAANGRRATRPAADAELECPRSHRPLSQAVLTGSDAEQSFKEWIKRLPGNFHWDWAYQQLIFEQLERVTNGDCRRLMIFLPPRHGKSELAAVRYPAWRLRRQPEKRIIVASYSQRLANMLSRKVRGILCEDAAGSAAAVDSSQLAAAGAAGDESVPRAIAAGPMAAVEPVLGAATASAATDESVSVAAAEAGGNITEISSIPNPPPETPPFKTRTSRQLQMFPFISQRPANSVAEWGTAAGGGLKAVGVRTGVAGFGADLIVIDDPVAGRGQANSQAYRDATYQWYLDDIRTRLEPGGSVILIQTRWHEDDLAGRLLADQQNGGDCWEVISLPAIAEGTPAPLPAGDAASAVTSASITSPDGVSIDSPDADGAGAAGEMPAGCPRSIDPLGRAVGEPLCPERFDVPELEQTRRSIGSWSFAALYQQRPAPAEGGVLKRKWFTIVDTLPEIKEWKRGTDLAVSTKETADYTASVRCGFDEDGNLYISDVFRRRIEYPDQRRWIIERILAERDTEHGIEESHTGKGLIAELRTMRHLRGRRFHGVKIVADKTTRAHAWSPLAEEGRLRLLRAPWNRDFIEEATTFPTGRHDDQIDALSVAFSMFKKESKKFYAFD